MGRINALKKFVSNWKTILLFSIIGLMFINGSPYFFGDAYGYYHTAKTIVSEGQINTFDIPEYTPYAAHGVVVKENGQAVSVYPPGVSILWWPFLKVASFFDQGTIYTDYFKAFNGHSFADGFSIIVASAFYTYISVLMLVKLLEGKGFSRRISLFVIVAAYICTFAFSYATEQPGYSHTYEVFAVSLFLFCLEKFRKNPDIKKFAVFTGIAAGLLIAIRLTDAILFVPMLFVLYKYWRKLPLFVIGALPFIAFLFYYNYANFGSIFANGYQALWNQNFDFRSFHLFDLIFSDFRGLLFWSPAVILTLVFLWIKPRDKWQIFIYTLPPLFVFIPYIFWPYWYAGDSIGQRFFIIILPFVTYGLANAIQYSRHYKKTFLYIFILGLICYSAILTVLYRVSPTGRLVTDNSEKAIYYAQTDNIPAVNLASPFDMFNYQFSIIKESKSVTDYVSKLTSGFNGGRSLLLLAMGQTDPLVIAKEETSGSFTLYLIANPSWVKTCSNIQIYIEDRGSYIETEQICFNENHSININCGGEFCTSNSFFTLKPVESTPEMYLKVTYDLNIWVTSDQKIRFINEKLTR